MLSNEAKALCRAVDTVRKALEESGYESAVSIRGGRLYDDTRELCARDIWVNFPADEGGASNGVPIPLFKINLSTGQIVRQTRRTGKQYFQKIYDLTYNGIGPDQTVYTFDSAFTYQHDDYYRSIDARSYVTVSKPDSQNPNRIIWETTNRFGIQFPAEFGDVSCILLQGYYTNGPDNGLKIRIWKNTDQSPIRVRVVVRALYYMANRPPVTDYAAWLASRE